MASKQKKAAPKGHQQKQQKSNKSQSKSQLILKHLKSHKKGITSWDAFEKYNATRLSSIIFNLRSYGYDIITTMEQTDDGIRYARYILKEVS